ncbi:zinc metalloproteinase nas-14 [Trichonephila inaurata madagascariensis]|uniref:Metalloendopeptidase n=1 Tax=Trichonephila inaurata madagascariensis TaxID=2747483 RepID=A0A8X6YA63_9ARAC|nr:zinc metalloproteinase nas-14 [Trichonephila inaurata madagascariensis]
MQVLSLESPICFKKGIILHEMMHTLGFLHEHSRFDRDEYVEVVYDNIMYGADNNFVKLFPSEMDDFGLDYDYHSVTHYPAWSFAENETLPTLKPKNDSVSLEELGYGQTAGILTELDIRKINKLYECP